MYFFSGMSIAGLTADAKSVSRWMRTECLTSRFYHNCALRMETLMCDLGNKMQNSIQLYNRRPYGVGLVVAGYDELGPHIYQVSYLQSICVQPVLAHPHTLRTIAFCSAHSRTACVCVLKKIPHPHPHTSLGPQK